MRIKIWFKSDIEVTDNYDITLHTASPEHAGATWIILQFTPIDQCEPSVSSSNDSSVQSDPHDFIWQGHAAPKSHLTISQEQLNFPVKLV